MNATLKPNDSAQARAFFEQRMEFTTGPVELSRELENPADLVVVDLRAAEDFAQDQIPGAINLPQDTWNAPHGLSKERLNVLYCYSQVCHLAATDAVQFAGQGYPVMGMDGGFAAWAEHDLEVEKSGPAGKATDSNV